MKLDEQIVRLLCPTHF